MRECSKNELIKPTSRAGCTNPCCIISIIAIRANFANVFQIDSFRYFRMCFQADLRSTDLAFFRKDGLLLPFLIRMTVFTDADFLKQQSKN